MGREIYRQTDTGRQIGEREAKTDRYRETNIGEIGRKEGNVLFSDALNTFYLGYMASEDHSDSERGNPLLPHGLLIPINSKGSFICTIPQTG